MRLFHYTGSEHVSGIERHGLTQGGVALSSGVVVSGYQWLTDDPCWDQGWATRQIIHCDRTEVRFTIAIPKTARHHLHRWRDFAELVSLEDEVENLRLLAGGGDEHWYIFVGRLPPAWIRRRESRPMEQVA